MVAGRGGGDLSLARESAKIAHPWRDNPPMCMYPAGSFGGEQVFG